MGQQRGLTRILPGIARNAHRLGWRTISFHSSSSEDSIVLSQSTRIHWGSWFAVLVLCVGIIGGLGYYKFTQIQRAIAMGAAYPEPSEAVVVVPAVEGVYRSQIEAVGEVRAIRSATMVSELPGRITRVGFGPGEQVAAGDVLLELDTREERAELEALAARLELAERTLERNERLSKVDLLAASEADAARAEARVARSESKRLAVIIDKKTLRAPFAARTGLDDWQVGEFAQAGQTITTLVGLDAQVWVDFSIPQERMADIRANLVALHLPGRPEPLTARLVAEQPAVDPDSRMLTLRAVADASDPALKPGAFARVTLKTGPEKETLMLPATALRRDAFGPHVYVLEAAEPDADAPHRARRRPVEVAAIQGEVVFIAEGLAPGERVATEGSFKLRDGLLTRATEAPGLDDAEELASTDRGPLRGVDVEAAELEPLLGAPALDAENPPANTPDKMP